MFGNPISFEARPQLTVQRGQLLSEAERGVPVHAAAFIRQRTIVLETDLFSQHEQLRLILAHELFHFVWVRLSNGQRHEFAALLMDEIRRGARGEVGESAAVRKGLFQKKGSPRLRRDYVCESFCDSGAAFFSGVVTNEGFTLAERWAKRRYAWLLCAGAEGWKC